MVNARTAIRIMLYEIREKNPSVIKFVIDDYTVNSILLYMQTRKYDTILYMFGEPLLLEILNMFEEEENYEECIEIKKQIDMYYTLTKQNIS